MALVLGLGNPGPRYARTRHNVGWRAVEMLVARWRATPVESTPLYRAWRAERGVVVADLMIPLTYMNLSGEAVAAWRERHALEPADLVVVSDDVYLPTGHLRIRTAGSSGGHNGLESIEAVLGSNAYGRVRIGVGAVDSGELREHVLAEPDEEERKVLEQAIETAADAVTCWLEDGAIAAMNRFNRRAGKEVSES